MNDIFHKLGYINLVIVIFLIFYVITILVQDKSIRTNIKILENDPKVMKMRMHDRVVDESHHIALYKQQTYSFKLEDFFVSDIYRDLASDVRVVRVQNDYFDLFSKAIDSILNSKTFFEDFFKILNDPNSLQYKVYIPLVKFAKFSVDYNTYLLETSQQQFTLRVETRYSNFQTDPKYFSLLKTSTCKKRVHIMYYMQKAIELYSNSTTLVNECIYHDVCKIVPKNVTSVVQEEQCSL